MVYSKVFLQPPGSELARGDRPPKRHWSKEMKARIVAETLKPRARVKSVAQKFDVPAKRLSEWRRLTREGKLVASAHEHDEQASFAPVVVCENDMAGQSRLPPPGPEKIEIAFQGALIKLGVDTSAPRIAEITRAVGVVA